MSRNYTRLTFTDTVKQAQEQYGARAQAARMEDVSIVDNRLSQREVDFIRRRDGFYVASVGETGWPYVQFRGGPPSFVKILDEQTIAFADFRGNRQYITTGNIRHNNRVSLFFMDYANKQRLKVMARAEVVDAADHPQLTGEVEDAGYRARVERVVIYRIEAFDWNCPQHITPRFTEGEFAPVIEQYETRIRALEAELERYGGEVAPAV